MKKAIAVQNVRQKFNAGSNFGGDARAIKPITKPYLINEEWKSC